MTPINDTTVLAEVKATLEAYESALASSDPTHIRSFLWDAANPIHFTGFDRSLRSNAQHSIKTFGYSFASVEIEYEAIIDRDVRTGRETQSWAKMGDQWKIISLHNAPTHETAGQQPARSPLEAVLQRHGISVEEEWKNRIEENFSATEMMAAKLMSFPLTETIEPAPVFKA